MKVNDYGLSNLLDLDGERIVIDDAKGLWVKIEAKKARSRETGVRYSLTLHDKNNKRILGFDNAHDIEYGAKHMVKPKRTFEHIHVYGSKQPEPYNFTSSSKLLEDFWAAVNEYMSNVA